MILLAASLFFTNPLPLEMPQATAFIQNDGKRYRLVDRFNAFDLWTSRSVLGRWCDDDGRTFVLSRLDVHPPLPGETNFFTRVDYYGQTKCVGRRDNLRPSIELLTDCALSEKPRSARQISRGMKAVDYWQHPTNETTIVCTFRPEKSECWFLATWELVEGDRFAERMLAFEHEFLDQWRSGIGDRWGGGSGRGGSGRGGSGRGGVAERELLRRDAHHGIAAYDNWSFVDGDEFTVLSDIRSSASFLVSLTNDLHVMRRRYAEVMPTHIDGTNVLCVARVFADRDEYLDAVGDDLSWTAAYWSPSRRELVAYLPPNGEAQLLKTIRHEAFHQYLSYATAMIGASPWLNEGYAQFFEDGGEVARRSRGERHTGDGGSSVEKGKIIELPHVSIVASGSRDEGVVVNVVEGGENQSEEDMIDALALLIPAVLGMDYAQFYGGSDLERHVKYRLAWSIAAFIERGADDVRFRPFRNLKRDYFATLFREYRSADVWSKATKSAFGNEEALKLFIAEWKKYWKE